jgi:Ca-activated chloride channel family protein
MPTLHIQHPVALGGLALLPFVGLLWLRACRRAARCQDAFGGPASPRGESASAAARNLARGFLRLAALAALTVGIAGPVAFQPGALSPSSVPVTFVLDVSASMAAADASPDRLADAQQAVAHVCSLLPGARTALVAAGQDAAVVCPLTADRQAFLRLLEEAETNWMGGGTRLAPALEAARDLLHRDGGAGVVVLVSDGEDHGEPLEQALEQLRRNGATVHTLVIGSPQGVELEGSRAEAAHAEPVVTRAQPEQMARWAAAGGGHAWSGRAGLPTDAGQIVPPGAAKLAAERAGMGVRLSVWLYVLAAALLAADRLLF